MSRKGKKIGVNLSKLSRTTGYSVSHLSRVIRQETNPSVDCLERMGKALNLNMEFLLKIIKERRLYAWKNN